MKYDEFYHIQMHKWFHMPPAYFIQKSPYMKLNKYSNVQTIQSLPVLHIVLYNPLSYIILKSFLLYFERIEKNVATINLRNKLYDTISTNKS